jgi:tRNA A-37 threonylcarbamoyl transferase component Bud32
MAGMGNPDNLSLPKTIGRYQVQHLLGAGAMGIVVLAEDPRIKRRVAIKLMKQDSIKSEADQQEFLARFQREAEVSGLLNHPGIVAIYDVGEVEGYGPFLAMEFVQGKPLDSLIKGGSPLSIKEKLRIAAGIADALDHAHLKGIVHRDVKPGNVMVGEDGRPKLMDFGIAKREDASLTQTGTFLGTPSYASPEQIREGVVTNRSDVFSFGVLVFELMSGQSPFPGSSINTILYRIVNEPPVEIQPPVLGILSEGWARIFSKVLAKKPEGRHPTCTAFIRELVDSVAEMPREDRQEILSILRLSGEAQLEELPEAFDQTMAVVRPLGRKVPWPWIAASALVVVAGAGWFLLAGPTATRFQIDSLPTGAKVFVNDVAAGNAPLSRKLAVGDKVRLELKGYQPSAPYEVKAGQAPPSAFQLQAIIRDEKVDSNPRGATVVLDEKPISGVTPLTLPGWNLAQSHRLTLVKGKAGAHEDFGPGESPNGKVFELKEGSTASTRPEPAQDPSAPGALRLVSGGFPVRVKVDGRDLGELAVGSKLPLAQGTHKLELSSAKYFFQEVKPVSVGAGQVIALNLPALATVSVETYPTSGRVFVDGRDAGIDSDNSSIQIAQGTHAITVRGARTKTETVNITGDRPVRFQL